MIPNAPTRHLNVVRYSHGASLSTQLLSLPRQCFIIPSRNKRPEVVILLGCSAVSMGDYESTHVRTCILYAFNGYQI